MENRNSFRIDLIAYTRMECTCIKSPYSLLLPYNFESMSKAIILIASMIGRALDRVCEYHDIKTSPGDIKRVADSD